MIDAVAQFTEGFDELADAQISSEQQQAIVSYYNNQLVKPVERTTGKKLDINALLPTFPAQRYLQAYYTAPFTSDDDSMQLDDVVRFALIGVGLVMILSYIWGVRVGGLFTALASHR